MLIIIEDQSLLSRMVGYDYNTVAAIVELVFLRFLRVGWAVDTFWISSDVTLVWRWVDIHIRFFNTSQIRWCEM